MRKLYRSVPVPLVKMDDCAPFTSCTEMHMKYFKEEEEEDGDSRC